MELILTDKAKERLLEMQDQNKPIKLAVTGYSWCGARFGIVSEKQKEEEKVYRVDGIDIIVSDELEGAIKGAQIDYSTSFFTKGFEITPIYSRR